MKTPKFMTEMTWSRDRISRVSCGSLNLVKNCNINVKINWKVLQAIFLKFEVSTIGQDLKQDFVSLYIVRKDKQAFYIGWASSALTVVTWLASVAETRATKFTIVSFCCIWLKFKKISFFSIVKKKFWLLNFFVAF